MPTLEQVLANIPGLAGYTAQTQLNQQQGLDTLKMAGGAQSILASLAAQQEKARLIEQDKAVRGAVMSAGGDPEKAMKAALLAGDTTTAAHLAPLVKLQREAELTKQFSGISGTATPDQLDAIGQRLALTGHPGAATVMSIADKRRAAAATVEGLRGAQGVPVAPPPVPTGMVPGTQYPYPADMPATDVAAFEKVAKGATAGQEVRASAEDTPVPTTGGGQFSDLFTSENPAIAASARMWQRKLDEIKTPGPQHADLLKRADMAYKALSDREAAHIQARGLQATMLSAQPDRPEPPVQTYVDGKGQLWERERGGAWTRARMEEGQPDIAPKPPGMGGVLNSATIRERQLAANLDRAIKPHLDVLNAYQRHEEIRKTGDNAQANQFIAQQLMQMSRTGQRVIPKAELERILGSGDLGNDWIGRGANMISQMVTGVRTPAIDRRLNELADAMAFASATRIGQEMKNARAAAPAGATADNITGTQPRIYGRFVITPLGTVLSGKNAADAQAKLDAVMKKAQEETAQ